MTVQQQIDQFLQDSPHAVVGASRDRSKYGNKVLRCYIQAGRDVFPVNPSAKEVEGLLAYPDLASLPTGVHGISVITPPVETEAIIAQAGELGVEYVWLQPGSESEAALALAKKLGMSVIAGGPCILVTLRFRE